MSVPTSVSWLALCAWIALSSACTHVATWQAHDAPWTEDTVAGAREVRVVSVDGREFVVVDARIDAAASELRGRTEGRSAGDRSIALGDIATLETRARESDGFWRGAVTGGFIGVTLVLVILVAGILSIGGGFAGS